VLHESIARLQAIARDRIELSRTSAIHKHVDRGATSKPGGACDVAAVPNQVPSQDQVPSPGPTAPE
jgi:hypothetical protein